MSTIDRKAARLLQRALNGKPLTNGSALQLGISDLSAKIQQLERQGVQFRHIQPAPFGRQAAKGESYALLFASRGRAQQLLQEANEDANGTG